MESLILCSVVSQTDISGKARLRIAAFGEWERMTELKSKDILLLQRQSPGGDPTQGIAMPERVSYDSAHACAASNMPLKAGAEVVLSHSLFSATHLPIPESLSQNTQ